MPRIIDWKQTIRNGATDLNVAERVIEGITQLFEEDASMLIRRANERTITALLACHLKSLFTGWNVDCEFNRDFKDANDIKKIERTRVVPDIIVHHRCAANVNAHPNPADHLLVIEVKQSPKDAPDSATDAKDIQKLAGFCRVHGYQNALFVKFITGDLMLGLWRIEWVAR
jgi:hypothetical protein